MLVEMCCICGFVHRDARINYRAYKPHYQWAPEYVKQKNGVTLNATICVACCKKPIDWEEFYIQKKKIPETYRIKWSLSAPLPDQYLEMATKYYQIQCSYVEL